MATKTLTPAQSLPIRGRNAKGQLIEGAIPAGQLPAEDPGLTIQWLLAKHRHIKPTPVLPE